MYYERQDLNYHEIMDNLQQSESDDIFAQNITKEEMEQVRQDGKISARWSAVTSRGQSVDTADSRYETLEILYPDASSFYQEVQGPEVISTSGSKVSFKYDYGSNTTSAKNGTHGALQKGSSGVVLVSPALQGDPTIPLHSTSDIIRQFVFENVNLINVVVVSRGEFSEYDLGFHLSLLESDSRHQLLSIKMIAANLFILFIVIYCICLCRSYRKKVDITVYTDWDDKEEYSDGGGMDSSAE